MDKSDFVRTRLTHSMEVSTIARQLGIMITGYKQSQKEKKLCGLIPENLREDYYKEKKVDTEGNSWYTSLIVIDCMPALA